MIIEIHGDNSSCLRPQEFLKYNNLHRFKDLPESEILLVTMGRECVNLSVSDEPKSLSEAVTSSNGNNWIQTMEKEMNSLYENEV